MANGAGRRGRTGTEELLQGELDPPGAEPQLFRGTLFARGAFTRTRRLRAGAGHRRPVPTGPGGRGRRWGPDLWLADVTDGAEASLLGRNDGTGHLELSRVGLPRPGAGYLPYLHSARRIGPAAVTGVLWGDPNSPHSGNEVTDLDPAGEVAQIHLATEVEPDRFRHVGDLDGDGDADLVVLEKAIDGVGGVHVLLNRLADGVTAVAQESGGAVAAGFLLGAAFPNPPNPEVTIPLALAADLQHARLVVYNVLGQRLRTLVDGPLSAGEHRVSWDGRDDQGRVVPSRVYFYRLEADGRPVTGGCVRVE